MTFLPKQPAAAAVLALATLDEVQRRNRDDESDENSPGPNVARGKGVTRHVCVLEH